MYRVLISAALALLAASATDMTASAGPVGGGARGGGFAGPAPRIGFGHTPRHGIGNGPRPGIGLGARIAPRGPAGSAARKLAPVSGITAGHRFGTLGHALAPHRPHLIRRGLSWGLPVVTSDPWIVAAPPPPAAQIIGIAAPPPDSPDQPRRNLVAGIYAARAGGCHTQEVRVEGRNGPRTINIIRC